MWAASDAYSRPPIVGLVDITEPVDHHEWQQLMHGLPADRQSRLRRYVRRTDLIRGLLADVLARTLGATTFGMPAERIGVRRNPWGAPRLVIPGPRAAEGHGVSITHAGRWVGCVVGTGPVGIDVEAIRPVAPGTLHSMFEPATASRMLRLAEPERHRTAVTWWTAVESYLKLLGTGLRLDPRTVRVIQVGDRLFGVRAPDRPRAWAHSLAIPDGHTLTVCTTGSPTPAPTPTFLSTRDVIAAHLHRHPTDLASLGATA